MKNLTTPCCDAPLTVFTQSFGVSSQDVTVESIMCSRRLCGNSWDSAGIANTRNEVPAGPERVEHLVGRAPGIIIGANPNREDHHYILWEGDHSGTINSHSELDFERISS